jgi:hypothetical protein
MKVGHLGKKVELRICGGMANFENFRGSMKVWVM